MDYSGYWQTQSAPASSESVQGQWESASAPDAWGAWSQPAASSQNSDAQGWELAQTDMTVGEDTLPQKQPIEDFSHNLPPLPPSASANDLADPPPPLPDGPPPLPEEAPPPLPAEFANGAALPEPGHTAGVNSYDEHAAPAQPDTAAGGVHQHGQHDAHAAQTGSADAGQAYPSHAGFSEWQANFEYPAGSQPDPQTDQADPAQSMQPDAYANTYQYAHGSWQTPHYAYPGSYTAPDQQQQQQFQPHYQQPLQHPWQQAATWHPAAAAASQYSIPAADTGAGQYLLPVASQPATYPGYEAAPAYVPAANDPYPASSYQPEAAPVMAGTASAAGLSGPSQTPIVVVQASDLFDMPGCAKRPKKIAILLRGIPGSGKTYIAQQLRKMELKVTGDAPRIHSIDDYFMTEVEREEEDLESGKRGKKRKVQELEYCYEQEMEGSYRRSLLKAYQKTMDEKRFNIVIVDAPNLLVEDFKPYWSAGQRAGYEVYILDPFESDPETCFKRNVHDRSLEDIQGAAACWEPAPSFYPRLDVTSLFEPSQGQQKQSRIVEVEMDAAEAEAAPASTSAPRTSRWAVDDDDANAEDQQPQASSKRPKAGKEPAQLLSVLEEGQGQAAEVFDGLTAGLDGLIDPKSGKGKSGPASHGTSSKAGSSLSALSKRPGRKSVRWADQAEKSEGGFSIGGTAALQLETVYVLSGLGPPEADGVDQKGSFAAKARAERSSEHSFKNVMLANKQK